MKVAKAIAKSVDEHARVLRALSEDAFETRIIPGKWSPKEIIGHLCDSGQNNIQRFIRGQYEDSPKIVYAQEEWVKFSGYATYKKDDLIQLWASINHHLCHILTTMDPRNYEKMVNTGEPHSLAFLAEDYHTHMVHHLGQLKERIKQ